MVSALTYIALAALASSGGSDSRVPRRCLSCSFARVQPADLTLLIVATSICVSAGRRASSSGCTASAQADQERIGGTWMPPHLVAWIQRRSVEIGYFLTPP